MVVQFYAREDMVMFNVCNVGVCGVRVTTPSESHFGYYEEAINSV